MSAPTTTTAVWCPFCQAPVAGLLAGCAEPACVRRDLDEDQVHMRRADQ